MENGKIVLRELKAVKKKVLTNANIILDFITIYGLISCLFNTFLSIHLRQHMCIWGNIACLEVNNVRLVTYKLGDIWKVNLNLTVCVTSQVKREIIMVCLPHGVIVKIHEINTSKNLKNLLSVVNTTCTLVLITSGESTSLLILAVLSMWLPTVLWLCMMLSNTFWSLEAASIFCSV